MHYNLVLDSRQFWRTISQESVFFYMKTQHKFRYKSCKSEGTSNPQYVQQYCNLCSNASQHHDHALDISVVTRGLFIAGNYIPAGLISVGVIGNLVALNIGLCFLKRKAEEVHVYINFISLLNIVSSLIYPLPWLLATLRSLNFNA